MKLMTLWLIFLIAIPNIGFPKPENAFTGGEVPKKIAVLYFDHDSEDPNMMALRKGLADMLITDLSDVPSLNLIERGRIEDIISEQDLQKSKSIDNSTAVRIGKLLGVEIVLTGSFFEVYGTLRIDARFIEVETGKILKAEGVQGPKQSFFDLEKELAVKIIESLDQSASEESKVKIRNDKVKDYSFEFAMSYSKALDDLDNGDIEKCTMDLNKLLAKNPDFQPAKMALFKCKSKAGKTESMDLEDLPENQNSDYAELRGGGDPLKGLNVSNEEEPITIGNYYALLIGIDNYSGIWRPLKNAVNDAQAVEDLLKTQYNFQNFTSLYNEQATRRNILAELEKLVELVKVDDNVLIYYSGHGEFNDKLNKGYWVPSDAKSKAVAGYISNSDIQTFLGGIKSRHTLLVSDACFSGDIFRGNTVTFDFENTDSYYKKVHKLPSRKAITSGGVEPVMDGGKNGHSVFAWYFLKSLTENEKQFFDASELFNSIRVPVINNSDQTPDFKPIKNTGDEGGQFVFIKNK